MTRMKTGIAVALATLMAAACGDSDTVGLRGPAQVTVLLTDAPTDYIAEAWVDIGAVELVPAGGGPIVTLSDDGTDGPVDLLELQDAATTILADAEIEAGSYAQLRLIVESATVKLADDWTFKDGSTEKELEAPSGPQTGIKLLLTAGGDDEGPLKIPPGELVLVVDFDVSQSFVIQGNPNTPAGIHGMLFKPTLRVAVLDVAGSISGTVSAANDSIRVDSLRVRAEPVDDGLLEEYQTQSATTRTREDGTYTLHFLVPGEYTVRVTPADTVELKAEPDSIRVVVDLGEDVEDVDFEIDSIP